MKEKFQRFMMGRYGADEFSRFLLVLMCVAVVLSFFIRGPIINILLLALIFYCYFRMFSRNHPKRYAENQKYLGVKNKIFHIFNREKDIAKQRKDYHFYTCPNCKQKIRIPKGKGKIEITCPKCRTQFIKKS